MRTTFFTSVLLAISLPVLVCCKDDKQLLDVAGNSSVSVKWHYGDVVLLDSTVGYDKTNTKISTTVLFYDEYGRKTDSNVFSGDGEECCYKTEWSYSEDGKNISVIHYELENGVWKEKIRDIITVVSERDSCRERYLMENGVWVLYGKFEHACDVNGNTILQSSYYISDNYGAKWEYAYDENGYRTLERYNSWKEDKWSPVHQFDCVYDDRGDCLYRKTMRLDQNSGTLVGDSLIERSFDSLYREDGYSLKIWDRSKTTWVGIRKYALAYDDRGNVIENTGYTWDVNDWVLNDKTSKTFDEEGRMTSVANYLWSNGAWTGVGFKYEKKYDVNGCLVFEGAYSWNASEGNWVLDVSKSKQYGPDEKTVHYEERDATGIVDITLTDTSEIKIQYLILRTEDGEVIEPVLKSVRNMDDAGRIVQAVSWSWNGEEWMEIDKTILTYDLSSDEASARYDYYKQNGEWVLSGGYKYVSIKEGNTVVKQKYVWEAVSKKWKETAVRDVMIYDGSDRITTILSQRKVWDNAVDMHWEDSKRTEYSYDSDGNWTGFVYSYWNGPENIWIYGEKQEYAFDAAGNKIMESNYMFDNNAGKWIGGEKWEAEYDENGNQTLRTCYIWYDQWIPSIKDVLSYDNDGNVSDRANYSYSYRNGAWDWIGEYRIIYWFDSETKTYREYNLDYNYATQTWEGNRISWETYESGAVRRETAYSWKDDQWVVVSEKEFDSNGNVLMCSIYDIGGQGYILEQQMEYVYDSMGRLILVIKRDGDTVEYDYYSVHGNVKIIETE